ncbi:DUF5994 family protein [Spirilliplanes yamanashiensis]|uniref:Uncharacterized protein n=1 Tax=Spirilliplanes yamanashiensis TaxID=42233 RepID=A0A8J3Y8B6_9ACTN|nr:DUF5994 family protein [Spirilliplanes yamanashiensis]MDP9817232.1 hypothetical protein [Spirilliplanes yamanashiensis]GIJ03115.1 hypothetical protein Sya03_24670 [Spirilliplanes yamanashiensis]
MTSITARATIVAPTASSSPPRLTLAPVRAGRAVLDGAWWPRSLDPGTELRGLVRALSVRYGPIRHLMLNSVTWDTRPRRLAIGDGAVVRVGWFASVDPAVVIATTHAGDQIDLLVVPPRTAPAAAAVAMAAAADPADLRRASAILAAMPAAPVPGDGADEQPVWDDEGGHTADRPDRATHRSAES